MFCERRRPTLSDSRTRQSSVLPSSSLRHEGRRFTIHKLAQLAIVLTITVKPSLDVAKPYDR